MCAKFRRRWLIVCVFVGWVAGPAPGASGPLDPPQGVFSDDWFVLKLNDLHSGHMHSTMERKENEIHTMTKMFMAITRAGQKIEVTLESGSRESLDGRPLAFDGRMNLATAESVVSGKIANGKVRMTSTQFGVTQETEFDLPEGAMMSWGQRRAAFTAGFEPGTRYTVQVWEPMQSPGMTIPTTVEIIGPEEIELFGEQVKAIKARSTTTVGGEEILGFAWTDQEGEALRMDMPLMGMNVQLLRADESRARDMDEPGELMVDTLVRPDRAIHTRQAKRVVYRLTPKEGAEGLGHLPETGMQRVIGKEGSSVVLAVAREDHKALQASEAGIPEAAPEMRPYLASGPMINWKDPEVMKMAREARGEESSAYRVADGLRRYVTNVIADKNLDVGFATASEVARKREGDCSEHGVLLAALGRANGIPSRVVVGLVYVDEFAGQQGVFGFHLWTQMHIGGKWVDLDAAMRETNCNPTHIAVATSSLEDEGLLELVGPLLRVIGNLKIEVLEIES